MPVGHLDECYGLDVSPDLISAVTDAEPGEVLDEVAEWQNRPLEPLYPPVFFDARHWCAIGSSTMTTRVKIRDEDILIAVVDGLKGFPDAITAVFPETQVQTCVRHRARTVANGEGTLEEGEGPVVGIEHHLRSPSGSNQWHFQRATVHALHPHPPIQITGRAGLLEITKGGQF